MKPSFRLFVLLFLAFSGFSASAQSWVWAKSTPMTSANRYGRTTTDASGNVIASWGASLAKYNSAGTLLWKKDATSGFACEALDACTDAAGNIYVAGSYTTSVTLGTTTLSNSGGEDAFVAKFDASGNVLWACGAGGADNESAASVATDAWGNVYIAGRYSGHGLSLGSSSLPATTGWNTFFAKYSSAGSVKWARAISDGMVCGANAIATDNSGNILLAGEFSALTMDIGPITLTNTAFYSSNIYLAKFDTSGSVLWATSAGSDQNDNVSDIAVDPLGNSYIVGAFRGRNMFIGSMRLSSGPEDQFIRFAISYDASGEPRWAKAVQGDHCSDIVPTTAVDNAGNMYITGIYNYSFKFGSTTLTSRFEDWKVFVAKYSTTGAEQWAISVASEGEGSADGIAIDNTGRLYINGFGTPGDPFSANVGLYVGRLGQVTGLAGPGTAGANISVYPNPSTDIVNVTMNGKACDAVYVTDATGRAVKTVYDSPTIDMAGMVPGVYTLRILVGDQSYIHKMVKE